MTEKQLKDRCAHWQKVLRLQDWRIDARFATSDELAHQGDGGICELHQDSKIATIRILPEDAYNPHSHMSQAFPQDVELTLVHELVHIHFDKVMDPDAEEHEEVMQEQAIQFVAEALVALSRGEG